MEVQPAPVAAAPEAEIADFDLSIDEPVSAAPVEASAEAPALAEEEVDLSDEWESISQEAIDAAAKTVAAPPAAHVAPVEATPEDEAFFEIEEPAASEARALFRLRLRWKRKRRFRSTPSVSEAIPSRGRRRNCTFRRRSPCDAGRSRSRSRAGSDCRACCGRAVRTIAASEAAPEAAAEPVEEPVDEFEFDLVPAGSDLDAPIAPAPKSPMTADQFLSDLSAELGADSEPASAHRFDFMRTSRIRMA